MVAEEVPTLVDANSGALTPEGRLFADKHASWARRLGQRFRGSYSIPLEGYEIGDVFYPNSESESVAHQALVDAIRTFDPAKRAKFKTHAYRRIRGEISDCGKRYWSTNQLNADQKHAAACGGRPAENRPARRRVLRMDSGSDPGDELPDEASLVRPWEGWGTDNAFLPCFHNRQRYLTPAEQVESNESISLFMARLTPRQREIVEMLADGHSQEEIAERIDLDPSWVSRIVKQIQGKAAEWAEKEGIDVQQFLPAGADTAERGLAEGDVL